MSLYFFHVAFAPHVRCTKGQNPLTREIITISSIREDPEIALPGKDKSHQAHARPISL
jgi:hypothetical protein